MVPKRDSVASSEGTPIYPFQVDVPSEPERRVLASIHGLAKISIILIIISACLSVFIALRAKSIRANPYALYWDRDLQSFRGLPPQYNDLRHPKIYPTEGEYMEEYFIRRYIGALFGSLADKDWCDCTTERSQGGLFTGYSTCFICNASNQEIYDAAAITIKQFAGADFRLVKLRRLASGVKESDSDLLLSLVGLAKSSKVSWADFRAEIDAGGREIVAYFTVISPYPNPRYQFQVSDAKYSWRAENE